MAETVTIQQEGEITKFAKGIDPIWKIAGAIIAFCAFMFSIFKTWSKIESNEQALKELKEQQTRQYSTHRNEIESLKKDTDEELDVLEEELDEVKAKILYHEGYEQGREKK